MSLRARLALLYAVLFLIAGGGLLALSYGLVAARLPKPATQTKNLQAAKLGALCKQKLPGYASPKQPSDQTEKLLKQCRGRLLQALKVNAQTQRDQTLHTMIEVALIGLALATLGSGVLGWIVSGRVLKPTEAALASRQRFIANAAHELRTPLSAIRTALDVTLSKRPEPTAEQLTAMAARVGRSVDQASATVEALLTLASAEVVPRELTVVDLATAAEDAIDSAAAEIARRRLAVETALEPATTTGDRVLIERLVSNLVINAVRHNDDGGLVTIRTAARDGTAELHVGNTGPIVAPETLATLFEPFARANRTTATEGVGLGLSIAQAIAGSHGASIAAEPRRGGGLEVTASFPRA
jgi:signal transduction histidine kinase